MSARLLQHVLSKRAQVSPISGQPLGNTARWIGGRWIDPQTGEPTTGPAGVAAGQVDPTPRVRMPPSSPITGQSLRGDRRWVEGKWLDAASGDPTSGPEGMSVGMVDRAPRKPPGDNLVASVAKPTLPAVPPKPSLNR